MADTTTTLLNHHHLTHSAWKEPTFPYNYQYSPAVYLILLGLQYKEAYFAICCLTEESSKIQFVEQHVCKD